MNIHPMVVFGEAGNPSNDFYENMCGEKLYAKNGEFHGGYGWKNLTMLWLIKFACLLTRLQRRVTFL